MLKYEIKVKSQMYGVTNCVITPEIFHGKRVFPCGNGEDHKINNKELYEAIECFKSQSLVESKIFGNYTEFNQEIQKRCYRFIEGLSCEITEDEYFHFLCCLPPLKLNGSSFYFSEALIDDLYYYFWQLENKYYCEIKQMKESM